MSGNLLELVTTTALIAVALSLVWLVAASYAPAIASWGTQETQVTLILALLTLALALVSVVALWHTRQSDLP